MEKDVLLNDFKKVLITNFDFLPCDFCENKPVCSKEKCAEYEEGKGVWDDKGNFKSEYKWCCLDFEFGTCLKLKDSPCKDCMKNNFSNWRYKHHEENE